MIDFEIRRIRQVSGCVASFYYASAEVLKQRLIGRGTETEEVINARLKRAGAEADGIESYDYILVNDVLEDCVDEMAPPD